MLLGSRRDLHVKWPSGFWEKKVVQFLGWRRFWGPAPSQTRWEVDHWGQGHRQLAPLLSTHVFRGCPEGTVQQSICPFSVCAVSLGHVAESRVTFLSQAGKGV